MLLIVLHIELTYIHTVSFRKLHSYQLPSLLLVIRNAAAFDVLFHKNVKNRNLKDEITMCPCSFVADNTHVACTKMK